MSVRPEVQQVIEDYLLLEDTEREALAKTLFAKADSVRKISASDAEAALASVLGFNANLRRAVISALAAKGLVGTDIGKVSAGAASSRRTLNSIAAANSENVPVLRQIKATAARMGYSLKDDEPVDVVELNKALQGRDVTARLALKGAMAAAGLIA